MPFVRKYMALPAIFLAGALFVKTVPCYGQLTSNVLRRVLLIEVGDRDGTAFTIDVGGRQYLITAKHVVAGVQDKAESSIKIMRKTGWKSLQVRVFKCDDPVDIAVLVPPEQLTVNFPLDPTSKGMAVGQDTYFVGFPYDTTLTYRSLPDVFGLVKRATVAGFESYPDIKAQAIKLDGYNNPGFSGSPLVFRDLSQAGLVYKVAGVVVNFLYDATPVVRKKEEIRRDQVTPDDLQRGDVVQTITDGKLYRVEDTNQLVKLNTGIATAWDIGSAIDLIKKHPVGPKTVDNFLGVDGQ